MITKGIVISGIIALSLLTGCSSEEPIENKAVASTTKPTAKVEPTLNGLTAKQMLAEQGLTISDAYSRQVCDYLEPLLADGYSSDSDMRQVAINVFNDKDQSLNSDQVVAIVVSSVMRDCTHLVKIVRSSN